MNEEIGNLKTKLINSKNNLTIREDEALKTKLDKVYSILESYKEKEIDSDLIEVVLKTQDLLEEIEQDDSINWHNQRPGNKA